jgi:hypothetical protein
LVSAWVAELRMKLPALHTLVFQFRGKMAGSPASSPTLDRRVSGLQRGQTTRCAGDWVTDAARRIHIWTGSVQSQPPGAEPVQLTRPPLQMRINPAVTDIFEFKYEGLSVELDYGRAIRNVVRLALRFPP